MKILTSALASLALSLSASVALGAQNARYVVVFKNQQVNASSVSLIQRLGGTVDYAITGIGVVTASGNEAFAAQLRKDASVLAVGSEHVYKLPESRSFPASEPEVALTEGAPTPADNLYGRQWNIRRIGAPAVWARLAGASIPAPRVAVLDVGVMDNHPDLAGQVYDFVSTSYCTTSGGPSNTASYPVYSTLIDFDAYPDWTEADGCTAASPVYELHGTHVAGTVAAKFGGGRVVGVAPETRIGAYKVFDRYRYTDPVEGVVDDVGAFDGPILAAIVDASMRGYPVISMSLGGYVERNNPNDNASYIAWDRVMKFANRMGSLIVASAGNEGVGLNGNLAHVPSDFPTVLSTSATGTSSLVQTAGEWNAAPGSDVFAFYSNFGAAVDVAAPGGDCGPTYPSACNSAYFVLSTGITPAGAAAYYYSAGTSMATPHVSAIAGYVRALHPDWAPGAVRAYLKATAETIGPRQQFGAGIVNADAAVR